MFPLARFCSLARAFTVRGLCAMMVLLALVAAVHGVTPRQSAPGVTVHIAVSTADVTGSPKGKSDVSLSLDVQGAPVEHSECTVQGTGTPGPWSGPTYYWNTPVSSDPSGVDAQLENTSQVSNTLHLQFFKAGDYTVTVTGGVSYSSSCGDAGDSDTKVIKVHVTGKVWDVGTPIEPGTAKVDAATIDWNESAQLSVEGAKDSDHWKDGATEGTEDDEISYQWSGQGTFSSPNAASSGWTPPTLPGDNASFTYKLYCTVDDKPKARGEGEGGTRDDSTPEPLMVEVTVTRKKWDKGSAIQLGGPITSDVTPQPSLQGGATLFVSQGQQVHLTIPTATDEDHWVYRDTEGDEADELNYTWSGGGDLSSAKGQSVTWTAPFLPGEGASESFTLTCTVDDKPMPIDTANGETGTRDDTKNNKSTITFEVVKRMWAPNKGIGYHPQTDAQGQFDRFNPTWLADGQVVSPSVDAANHKASALPGERVACALSEAHDWDSWLFNDMMGPGSFNWVEDSPLTYHWTATQGQFLVGEGEGAQLQSSADTREAVWVAPADGTSGLVTLTCVVDDAAGDRVNAPLEGGSRNDASLVRTVVVEVAGPKVTFTKLDGTALGASGARSCAGGIGLDGVHDFTILGTAKKPDGTLMPNAAFKLSFENNRGHDYSGDDPSIWPKTDWTTQDIKKAKFVTTDGNGNPKLVETLTVQTDDKGQFPIHVLSSDIVSSDIKIKVKRTTEQGQDVDAGEQACDFDGAVGIRRFVNDNDPTEVYPQGDKGWLFGQHWLNSPNTQTTAKMYLKFMIDKSKGNKNGNWSFVSGHRVLFEVADVSLKNDAQSSTSDSDNYATIVPTQNGVGIYTTVAADGAATAVVHAGSSINDANEIILNAYDESQWDN